MLLDMIEESALRILNVLSKTDNETNDAELARLVQLPREIIRAKVKLLDDLGYVDSCHFSPAHRAMGLDIIGFRGEQPKPSQTVYVQITPEGKLHLAKIERIPFIIRIITRNRKWAGVAILLPILIPLVNGYFSEHLKANTTTVIPASQPGDQHNLVVNYWSVVTDKQYEKSTGYVQLFNVTISPEADKAMQEFQFAQAKGTNTVIPKAIEFEGQRLVLAIRAAEGEHNTKAYQWRDEHFKALNIKSGISIAPVLAGYSYPQAITHDIWLMGTSSLK